MAPAIAARRSRKRCDNMAVVILPTGSAGAGAKLHVTHWLPEGRPRAIVLLAHGYAEHAGRYAHVAKRLTDAGYAVYAVDHWGHGNSDGEGGFVEGTFVIKAAVRAFEPAQRLAFDLAPNPATESLRISFGESLSSDARVSMFNTAGQQLRSLALPSGTLSYLLDVANLPDGVYIVTVQNERASGARKVVVRH